MDRDSPVGVLQKLTSDTEKGKRRSDRPWRRPHGGSDVLHHFVKEPDDAFDHAPQAHDKVPPRPWVWDCVRVLDEGGCLGHQGGPLLDVRVGVNVEGRVPDGAASPCFQ